MKQVYVINGLDEPLEHDFNLIYEDNKISCVYSDNRLWADYLHNQKAGSLKELEEGYVIKIAGQKIKLDFSDIQVLKILLLAENNTDYFEIRESTTIKKWPKDIETEENLR
jgi:hypothetical protein